MDIDETKKQTLAIHCDRDYKINSIKLSTTGSLDVFSGDFKDLEVNLDIFEIQNLYGYKSNIVPFVYQWNITFPSRIYQIILFNPNVKWEPILRSKDKFKYNLEGYFWGKYRWITDISDEDWEIVQY
jgi:hypothetical protein